MARGKCPRGVLCMSNTLAFVIVLFILLAFYIKVKYTPQYTPQPVQQQQPVQPVQPMQPVQQIQQVYSGDSRYSMAPEPLRVFQPAMYTPINIPTRGIPESFQSIGIINIDDKTLPLYGRRINNDRWNYYTRTDTYNPVPIPIRFQKRDCMDDIGCKEIMSGDEAHVMNKFGKTTIYNYNGPKYIPGFI